MANPEETKNAFEQCCLELVAMLDEEYAISKSGKFEQLSEINNHKASLLTQFQDYLFQFSLTPRGIPNDLEDHINAVHKASKRNAAFLSGAIDGTATILRELRKATEIKTFTGLYNPDGSFKHSQHTQKEFGKA